MKRSKTVQLALIGLTQGLLFSPSVEAGSHAYNDAVSQTAFLAAKCSSCSVAAKCSGGSCSVAAKCGGGSCSVAAKCGSGGCSVVANRDPQQNSPRVQDPSKVKGSAQENYDPNSENLGYYLMTEEELLLELNDEGARQYHALSPEGKALAREVASQRCDHTNACKGLNACKTDTNDCAGKGSCKGTGKCAISDKNLAVRIVAERMAEKRNQAMKGNGR